VVNFVLKRVIILEHIVVMVGALKDASVLMDKFYLITDAFIQLHVPVSLHIYVVNSLYSLLIGIQLHLKATFSSITMWCIRTYVSLQGYAS